MSKIKITTRRTPIYRSAGFRFENIEESEKAFQDENEIPQSSPNFIYTRYGNPTVVEAEQAIAKITKSNWALLASSGMSAIDTALSLFHVREKTGTWLFFSEIYGGTNTYIDTIVVERRGITVQRFNLENGSEKYDLSKLAETLDRIKPSLLFFEPVTNPLLIAVDGCKVIKMAKERNIKVIVDNTFATPCLWRPLESGADIVIHSATKYLAGHGNITAGVVCGNDNELHKKALLYRKYVGNILSPDDAYRLCTQVKTFYLRFSEQCKNAFRLAEGLEKHKAVKGVRYPGLESHKTHEEAKTLFNGNGFGAMITFELKGGRGACDEFIKRVSHLIPYSATLGDPETILIHVPTVFTGERFPFPGMIRLSVGYVAFEEVEKCIFDALDEIDNQNDK